jgi:hypothetical protein
MGYLLGHENRVLRMNIIVSLFSGSTIGAGQVAVGPEDLLLALIRLSNLFMMKIAS